MDCILSKWLYIMATNVLPLSDDRLAYGLGRFKTIISIRIKNNKTCNVSEKCSKSHVFAFGNIHARARTYLIWNACGRVRAENGWNRIRISNDVYECVGTCAFRFHLYERTLRPTGVSMYTYIMYTAVATYIDRCEYCRRRRRFGTTKGHSEESVRKKGKSERTTYSAARDTRTRAPAMYI